MPQTVTGSPAFVLSPEDLQTITNIVAVDVPLDNLFSEFQHRLLVNAIVTSYAPPALPDPPGVTRDFWVSTNVGMFKTPTDHLVPDVFLSLDVPRPTDYTIHKAYYLFYHPKPPDAIVEVVSNREGNELGSKMEKYALWGIRYYAVYDPFYWLGNQRLSVFVLRDGKYVTMETPYFPELGLGLAEWNGSYEGHGERFLRWHDASGHWLPTMAERATEAESVAEFQRVRAEMAESAAGEARQQAAKLLALLRQHGIDPGPPSKPM